MKRPDPIRGIQKVRSLACYNDTWETFKSVRKQYGLTSDQCLELGMRYVINAKRASRKDVLDEMIKNLQTQRASIE